MWRVANTLAPNIVRANFAGILLHVVVLATMSPAAEVSAYSLHFGFAKQRSSECEWDVGLMSLLTAWGSWGSRGSRLRAV